MNVAVPIMARPAGATDRSAGWSRTLLWVLWHALCAIGLPVVLVEVRLQTRWWEMSVETRTFLAGVSLTYLAAAGVLWWVARRKATVGLLTTGLVVGAVFAVFVALLWAAGISYSKSVLVMAAAASFVLLSLSLDLTGRLYLVLLPTMLVAVGAMVRVAASGWPADLTERTTAFYNVRLVDAGTFRSAVAGGGLEPLGSGILVGTGDGRLHYLDGDGTSRTLPYVVPVGREAFIASGIAPPIEHGYFRLGDILAIEDGPRVRLYAAHHFWHTDRKCIGLRVSETTAERSAFLAGSAELSWKTVYDSQPCLPFVDMNLVQDGASLLALDERTLLISVGDFGQDGYYGKASLPQDAASHYGKTIRLDLVTGDTEVYSSGHRNPQGTVQTSDERVWLVEQGPAGGDELNLIEPGENYGWPLVSYGVAYDTHSWPPNAVQGRHAGFAEPIFAWLPSIAITSVAVVRGDAFPVWKDDLLLGSLTGRVFRAHVAEGRVTALELVYETRKRIRDLIEAPDGRVAMLFDDGAVRYLEPVASAEPSTVGPPHPGQQIYRTCQNCHAIGSGTDHRTGPDLRGVLGRRVASAPGFEYSRALSDVPGRWNRERLDRFLSDPESYAPGTSMTTAGIGDPESRRLLIEYLATKD